MPHGLVSIITPTYNSSLFISDAINSVLAQSYSNWEMIIVDDGSNDNTGAIVNSFSAQNPKIKFFPIGKNVGAAEARNFALKMAHGRYIAFLDSDDIWLEAKLEKQLAFMKNNNYAFTFTSYCAIDESGNEMNSTIYALPSINYHQFLKNTIIGCLTVILDREQIGEFKIPSIKCAHDMALWLQILKKEIPAYGMNEVLAKYRIVSNSLSANKFVKLTYIWRVYRDIEKFSILRSTYYIIHFCFNAFKKWIRIIPKIIQRTFS